MKKMKQEKMDDDMAFLALHHYWNWHTKEGAEAFLKIIDETWEMYKKPIWITEFALSGVPIINIYLKLINVNRKLTFI